MNQLVHDQRNEIDFSTKKHQLIENELQNKLEQFQLIQEKSDKQKHDLILINNQKQRAINTYRQKSVTIEETEDKIDQLEKTSANEMNRIIKQTEENEQLKWNIRRLKQRIVSFTSRNQRQVDECALLNEKISLYTKLNDFCQQQEQCYALDNKGYLIRIENLHSENKRLNENIHSFQKKAIIILSSHHRKRLEKGNLDRINQSLSHPPALIRHNPTHLYTGRAFEDYSLYVNRLTNIIHECIRWRDQLAKMNQCYWVII